MHKIDIGSNRDIDYVSLTSNMTYSDFKAWMLGLAAMGDLSRLATKEVEDVLIRVLATMETTPWYLKRKVWKRINDDSVLKGYVAAIDNLKHEKKPELMEASVQVAHRSEWLAKLGKEREDSYRANLNEQVENLWRIGIVEVWSEDWFEDIEDYLEHLQNLGYHVFWSQGRRNNQGMLQHVYFITLEPDFRHMSEWKRRKDDV